MGWNFLNQSVTCNILDLFLIINLSSSKSPVWVEGNERSLQVEREQAARTLRTRLSQSFLSEEKQISNQFKREATPCNSAWRSSSNRRKAAPRNSSQAPTCPRWWVVTNCPNNEAQNRWWAAHLVSCQAPPWCPRWWPETTCLQGKRRPLHCWGQPGDFPENKLDMKTM